MPVQKRNDYWHDDDEGPLSMKDEGYIYDSFGLFEFITVNLC